MTPSAVLDATLDIAPRDHMGPLMSLVLLGLLLVLLIVALAIAITRARKWRQKGRAADRALDPEAALREGEGFVCGVVELDDAADFAVVVEIRQVGKETKRKGGVSHKWTEVERKTLSNPFWIRLPGGERVRVEPGADVKLIDKLDILVHDEKPTERFRIAELSAGEMVIASGALTSERSGASAENYREAAPRTWVLRQSDGARLHLTAERLGDQHRRVGNSYLKSLVFGWIPSVLLVAALCGPFMGRLALGEVTTIVVSGKYYSPSHGKKGPSWGVNFEDPSGPYHSTRLRSDDWGIVTEGDRMAYIHVPRYPWMSGLGGRATLPVFSWIFSLIVVLTCLSAVAIPPNKPWYEAKSQFDSGGGRLPSMKPSTRRVYSRDS
ncbi:MAG: hypothetical protein AB8H86_17170 [Polyangiales bacterium]